MEQSVEREPDPPFAFTVPPAVLAAAPAALATMIGVLALGFMTTPVRPYAEARWAPVDIFALFVLALGVGFISRSLSGFVGTIVGLTAAVAVQLFILAEQAASSPDVVTSLREPVWSGQVLAALVTGIVTLVAGYFLGAGLGTFVTPTRAGPAEPSANRRRQALVALGTVLAATLLLIVLVRDAATSPYVPAVGAPLVLVSVQGDRILAVTPESVPAGRIVVDTNRAGAGSGASYVWLDGPLSDQQLATLQSGFKAQGESTQLLPFADDVTQHARQFDLGPGLYAIVVAELPFELVPEAPVRALDARTIVVAGPEPPDRLAGSGLFVSLGLLFGLAVAGGGTAGTLLVSRRVPNPIYAGIAGALAAAITWLVASAAISQGTSPF